MELAGWDRMGLVLWLLSPDTFSLLGTNKMVSVVALRSDSESAGCFQHLVLVAALPPSRFLWGGGRGAVSRGSFLPSLFPFNFSRSTILLPTFPLANPDVPNWPCVYPDVTISIP